MADGVPVGTEFQSWTADGKYECRVRVCSGVGDLELMFEPLQLPFLGSSRPAAGFTGNKTVHDLLMLHSQIFTPLQWQSEISISLFHSGLYSLHYLLQEMLSFL